MIDSLLVKLADIAETDFADVMTCCLRKEMECNMRYIVKVECLSAEVLAKLKKSSRILHIFSLIDNTIALETEDVGHIKGLKEVRRVYESGKAKLMLTDALNRIGIFDVQNRNVYGDGVWIGVIDSGIDMTDP